MVGIEESPAERGTRLMIDPLRLASCTVGDELTLLIESLAFGGEGVSRIELEPIPGTTQVRSLVVFVEDVVPEDKVLVRVVRKKRNYAQAVLVKILEPSRLRIQSRCRHFGRGCGGCTWQFLSYENQLRIKEQQVKDALRRIGGIDAEITKPILGSEPWFYRNKMEFSFSVDRDGKLDLGLHLRHRHYDVVELTECFLLEPYVGALVTWVRNFFRLAIENGTASFSESFRLQSFTIRQAKNTGEMMLILSAETALRGDPFETDQENFMQKFAEELKVFWNALEARLENEKIHPVLASIYYLQIFNQPGKPKRFEENLIWGKPTITETLSLSSSTPASKNGTLRFEISPQAFFQPNTKQAQLLYAKVMEAAELTGKEIVFDLFCGTGTIGLFCAHRAKKVYGIELNPSAIENARANARLNQIENVEFLTGDVQKMLEKLPSHPDVIIVDPPRNGLAPKTVETVAFMKPKRLVYVSCNPTTLARDAALFIKTGYQLRSVQSVDMFPQTYHIESVALFTST